VAAESEAGADKEDASPKRLARRQSSMHWDNQRGALVISGDSATAAAVATTPSKGRSQPSTPQLGSSPSPRFVMGTGLLSGEKAPATPVEEVNEEDEGESGDEADDPSQPIGSASRTKRKNRAHRMKLKQRALLFQSPPQMVANSLSNSAPSFQTPQGSSNGVGRSPQTPALQGLNINALKMEALQRENEWKEAWIAHEIQSFQQREEERKVLKAQMNDERARWLAKLKDYTSELKGVREENLVLKQDLAAAKSVKRMETSGKARAEKFQTLQKNILNEEMLVWIREKAVLQAEIETLRTEKVAAQTATDELNKTIQSQSGEATTLSIALQTKDRELVALGDEVTSLRGQLSAAAGTGSQTSEQLNAAQNKLAEEVDLRTSSPICKPRRPRCKPVRSRWRNRPARSRRSRPRSPRRPPPPPRRNRRSTPR
jgi:predicted  nucleic acid-binding Zn-ribbon protein